MTFPSFSHLRIALIPFLYLACSLHASGQDSRFPAVIIKQDRKTAPINALVEKTGQSRIITIVHGKDSGIQAGDSYNLYSSGRRLTLAMVSETSPHTSSLTVAQGWPDISGYRQLVGQAVKLHYAGYKAGKYVPLGMDRLAIGVQVVGNIAVTTLDMNYHNATPRTLEGKLRFPLGEGQTVSRFAMDVEGKLREGVVVEKAKGRQVFEKIVRHGIDPGLLEWTKGNVFQARVYPLLPNQGKRIVVAYEQELQDLGDSFRYALPLDFPNAVQEFSVNVEVFKQADAPKLAGNEMANFQFKKWEDSYRASMEESDYLPDQDLTFLLPKPRGRQRIFLEEAGGENHFYLTLEPEVPAKRPKPQARKLGILWDASASGGKRNLEKELQLLPAFFNGQDNVEVTAIVFRDKAEPPRQFIIPDSYINTLQRYLSKLPYDGGTQLGSLDLTQYDCDEFLLFTDGVSNIGGHQPKLGDKPVHTINSNPVAEHALLRHIAQSTGGTYLNLDKLTNGAAQQVLRNVPFQFLGIEQTGRNAFETYPQTPEPVSNTFTLAGKLKTLQKTELTLLFGYGKEVVIREEVTLHPRKHKSNSGLARRLWAQKKIAGLELHAKDNEHAITQLGKDYSIVTRNTSLIVLDRFEDYIENRIPPPEPELRKRYFTQIEKIDQTLEEGKQDLLSTLTQNYALQYVSWWNKDIDPTKVRAMKPTPTIIERRPLLSILPRVAQSAPAATPPPSPSAPLPPVIDGAEPEPAPPEDPFGSPPVLSAAPSPAPSAQIQPEGPTNPRMNRGGIPLADNLTLSGFIDGNYTPLEEESVDTENFGVDAVEVDLAFSVGSVAAAAPGGNDIAAARELDLASLEAAPAGGQSNPTRRSGSIQLKKWNPQKPYLKKIEAAGEEEWYDVYLNERKGYANSSAFFLDVADFFYNHQKPILALRILSNIAEMETENAQLLRILGYRLMQAKQFKLAISVFQEVLDIREEEPQSFRDLALAYQADGQFQPAADHLWQIVEGQWDGRFQEIREIALTELNALIATNPGKVDSSDYRKELLKNLPVDVRVALSWDADNTDVDLWVTDPNGEKCYYSHRFTAIGGRMTPDCTQGYGPEVFLLKRALPGKYTVQAEFFGNRQQTLSGSTTLQMTLTTDFGRLNSESRTTVRRLEKVKDVVEVGTFVIPEGK